MKKTIYDIAKELGVAPSTVSKAMNGSSGVSEKLRTRILDYAKEVRYFANASASRLKSKNSFSLGVIFTEHLNIGLQSNYFASIIQYFKDYVESEGYEITFVISNLGKQKMSYVEFCEQKNIQGVYIVTSTDEDHHIKELIDSDIHIVSTDIYDENIYTIISDNESGTHQVVDYFVSKGIREIGHVKGPIYNIASIERYDSYRDALDKHEIEYKDEFVVESSSYTFEGGYQAAKEILKRKSMPKAFYCASDHIAMGFIRCLTESGIKVPEDVSVFGFDDLEFSKIYKPALSTVRQDVSQLGEAAAKKLIALIKNDVEHSTGVEKIPVELIIRDSSI